MMRKTLQAVFGTLLLLLPAFPALAGGKRGRRGCRPGCRRHRRMDFHFQHPRRGAHLGAVRTGRRPVGNVSQTIRTTPAEILEYFEESSARRPNLRMILGEYHVRLYGDIAINSGYYSSRNSVDGKDVVVPMRFTFTYRKEGDRWVIVNHHSSRFASTP